MDLSNFQELLREFHAESLHKEVSNVLSDFFVPKHSPSSKEKSSIDSYNEVASIANSQYTKGLLSVVFLVKNS